MTGIKTLKRVINISFDEKELEAISILMDEIGISSPQKLIRALITQEMMRGSKSRVRKPFKGDSQRSTIATRRKALEDLPDGEFLEAILPLLVKEFAHYGLCSFYFENEQGDPRKLLYNSPTVTGEKVPLDTFLNEWQKDKSLEKIYVELSL